MFVLLGVAFIAYEGTSALSGLYEAYGAVDLAYTAERWVSPLASSVPDDFVVSAVALAAALFLGTAAYRRRRRKPHGLAATEDSSGVGEFAGEKPPDKASR